MTRLRVDKEIVELKSRLEYFVASMRKSMDSAAVVAESLQAVHEIQQKLQATQRELISFGQTMGKRAGITYKFFTVAYLTRLAFCVMILLVGGFLNALSTTMAGWRTPNIRILNLHGEVTDKTTLPDIGHDIVGYLAGEFLGTSHIDWFELPDLFVSFVGPLTLLFVVVHPRRFLIVRRVCAVFALLNFLRACVFLNSCDFGQVHCYYNIPS